MHACCGIQYKNYHFLLYFVLPSNLHQFFIVFTRIFCCYINLCHSEIMETEVGKMFLLLATTTVNEFMKTVHNCTVTCVIGDSYLLLCPQFGKEHKKKHDINIAKIQRNENLTTLMQYYSHFQCLLSFKCLSYRTTCELYQTLLCS